MRYKGEEIVMKHDSKFRNDWAQRLYYSDPPPYFK